MFVGTIAWTIFTEEFICHRKAGFPYNKPNAMTKIQMSSTDHTQFFGCCNFQKHLPFLEFLVVLRKKVQKKSHVKAAAGVIWSLME